MQKYLLHSFNTFTINLDLKVCIFCCILLDTFKIDISYFL